MLHVRVFVSFDRDHDLDLRDRLEAESRRGSEFEISARSEAPSSDRWESRVRRQIGEADEVIVICGEHTEDSTQVGIEFRIVQEAQKPYFLLWGRREAMCTKPVGARPHDHMYSWTPTILHDQIVTTLRSAQPRTVSEQYKRP